MAGGKEMSLSVEETNRLRAELGLRPLRVEAASDRGRPARGEARRPPLPPPRKPPSSHHPPLSSIAAAAVLGDDNERDDRDGHASDEIEATEAWVKRMRAQEAANEAGSAKKASSLPLAPGGAESQVSDDASAACTNIRHGGLDAMDVGEETVLTFADTGVLDESGEGLNIRADVLENVHEREAVSAGENLRLRDGSALAAIEYDPTDDADFQNGGDNGGEKTGVLSKYDAKDEMVDYTLDGSGTLLQQGPGSFRRQVAARLKAAREGIPVVSVMGGDAAGTFSKTESDYFTKEEFAGLRKGRKKSNSKKRNKKRSTVRGAGTSEGAEMRVSRPLSAGQGADAVDESDASDGLEETSRLARLKALREAAVAREQEADDDDEEADSELYESLARARRSSAKLRGDGLQSGRDPSAAVLKSLFVPAEDLSGGSAGEAAILTETEQFVRSIGVSLGDAGDIADTRAEGDMPRVAAPEVLGGKNGQVSSGAASPKEVNGNFARGEEATTASVPDPVKSMALSGLEQTAGAVAKPMGIAYTLARLRNLGELQRSTEQIGRVRDERREDWKNGGGREVKLTYKDEFGRELTPKEEFRMMSHKFHGKGPGQNKREAAMRRQSKAKELREIDITESRALEVLREETKATQSAHVVISGAAAIQGMSVLGKKSLGSRSAPYAANGLPSVAIGVAGADTFHTDIGFGGQVGVVGAPSNSENSSKRARSEGKVEFSLGKKMRRH